MSCSADESLHRNHRRVRQHLGYRLALLKIFFIATILGKKNTRFYLLLPHLARNLGACPQAELERLQAYRAAQIAADCLAERQTVAR